MTGPDEDRRAILLRHIARITTLEELDYFEDELRARGERPAMLGDLLARRQVLQARKLKGKRP